MAGANSRCAVAKPDVMIATRVADTKTFDAAAMTDADMESGRTPHGRLIAAGPTQGGARISRKGLTPDRNTTQEHRGELPPAVHEVGHVGLDLLVGVEVLPVVRRDVAALAAHHVLGAQALPGVLVGAAERAGIHSRRTGGCGRPSLLGEGAELRGRACTLLQALVNVT